MHGFLEMHCFHSLVNIPLDMDNNSLENTGETMSDLLYGK
jgi:hypothetical protein